MATRRAACVILFAVAAVCGEAHADEPEREPQPPPVYVYVQPVAAPVAYSPAETPPEEDGPMAPQPGRGPGRGMKKAGIALTLAGLGAAALGGVLVGVSTTGRRSGGDYAGLVETAGLGLGVAFLVAGGGATLAGIPLWAVGAASESR